MAEANNSSKSKYLADLNPEQKEAVLHQKGPLLIVAGAGTGKTTVITRRLAYLIESALAKPQEVLAVTFTEKAAEEMEERVDRLLPFGYLDLWVSTFHSFCERILKEHSLDIGLSSNFKLMDETAAWLLIKQNLDKFNLDYYRPLSLPTKFIHALLNHFSRLKDEAIYPEDYLKFADELKRNFDDGIFVSKAADKKETLSQKEAEIETQRIQEIANAYHTYQQLLLQNNALDFGDLINYCLKLFEKRPKILRQYQEQFKYILVDEFQDTNWVQYELIKKLAPPQDNLTVTADDDQAIYRFRGASVSNVLQFRNDYPQAKEVILIKNYRSVQNILDLSYNFIQLNNPHRLEYQLNQDKEITENAKKKGLKLQSFKKVDKRLKAQADSPGTIQHLHFKTLDEELSGIARKILEIKGQDKKANYADFAILTRTNEAANTICKELQRQRLPYEFLASFGLYFQPVILDIISYLKVLDNYYEEPALNRVLNLPIVGISWEDLAKINQQSKRKSQTIYETLQKVELVRGLSKEAANKAKKVLTWLKRHNQLAKGGKVGDVVLAFLKETGYLKALVRDEREREIELIAQFYKKLKQFEENELDPSTANYVAHLNMELESGESGAMDLDVEKGPDAIRVMTIHSAKGLEFKYVFLPNLVDKRFPTIERKEPIDIPQELIKEVLPSGDIHLQEERRLFYVAMTRAKTGLFLSSAENYGGLKKKRVSRFLKELDFEKIGQEQVEKEGLADKKLAEKEPLEAKESRGREKWSLPHFSFTQFTAFDNCPLQYKFAHILKIPVPGSAVLSFGKTIHRTLYYYLKSLQATDREQENLFSSQTKMKSHEEQKEKVDKDKETKTLLEIYKSNWLDEWYEDKKQKQDYYKLGKEMLKNFLDDYLKKDSKIKAIQGQPGLELSFNLKLDKDIIKGKVDRVDELKDGRTELIDYKTGKSKDKLSKDDKDQLLIYQLALKDVLGKYPEILTYYYLRDNKKLSFSSSEEEREEFKSRLKQKVEEIKESDFAPTPGWQCKTCDFRDICEYRKL